ncbi:MAG: hypothetical protein PHF86_12095 [Candidatus Nanoarchaeia archaeon]|nr:hypothetical protein [Candidatus Nanoarchaeia archaeon]
MVNGLYNPANIKQYFGTQIITESGTVYQISFEGTIKGKQSIEDGYLKLIAGIDPEYYDSVDEGLDFKSNPKAIERLDEIIRNCGQELKPGLCLIASLIPESIQEKGRNGIITSPIKSIKRLN